MKRRLALLVLAASTVAFAKPPRLTLFIAVDSFGTDALQKNRGRFKAGLSKLLGEGAVYPAARYETLECVTAVGHATMATGTWAHRHGVVGNKYFNRATGKLEAPFFDPAHPVLEAPASGEDVSPQNLLAETLSDRLRLDTDFKGKAIAVSGKGRSAVPLAGHLGDAWWFHEAVGKFVTGTFYKKEFPIWVKSFNDKKLADAAFAKTWSLTAPQKDYVGEDDRPFESDIHGLKRVFPHAMTGGLTSPGEESYKALSASPFATEMLVEFAKAAIDGEQLGKDDVPDMLSVSFSAVDRTYHLYGPNSWEYQDHLIRFDKALGELIAAAERAAGGKANLLVVLTGDHGGANVPEEWASQGLEAQRVNPETMKKNLNAALEKQFGAPGLAVEFEEADAYLDWKLIDAKKLDVVAIRRAAAAWLAKQPEVFMAVSRDDLANAGTLKEEAANAYFPERSGDVLYAMKPYKVLEVFPGGTSHGAPWSYDSDVPIFLYGKGVKTGHYGQEAHPIDIAPTVSALMEMTPPASSEGRVLFESITLSK